VKTLAGLLDQRELGIVVGELVVRDARLFFSIA